VRTTSVAAGLLSDPTYGVPAITDAKALAPGCGLLVAAEPSERRSYQGEPRTHRDPGLDAQWVLDQGGDALKFFVQLRADRPAPAPGEPELVTDALAVCEEIIRDCRATGARWSSRTSSTRGQGKDLLILQRHFVMVQPGGHGRDAATAR
jgi:tagatose-1,6-bisphosphate aldolase